MDHNIFVYKFTFCLPSHLHTLAISLIKRLESENRKEMKWSNFHFLTNQPYKQINFALNNLTITHILTTPRVNANKCRSKHIKYHFNPNKKKKKKYEYIYPKLTAEKDEEEKEEQGGTKREITLQYTKVVVETELETKSKV